MKLIITFILLMNMSAAFGGSIIKVSSLGASPKGQFVAFEEFGFFEGKKPFSRIRIFNTWKSKYVRKTIKVNAKSNKESLEQVRKKAKRLAKRDLNHFNISS